ncbi:MAG: hypothetical protein COA80_18960 [Leeuwenhoekiella sp.]|nr:MAG: hypothetical protein COA80_18960 [Leeuwenhoekiella sp.]
MAIVKCSECGKDISNKAESCIYCGAPISDKKKTKDVDKSRETKKAVWVFIGLFAFMIIIMSADEDKSDTIATEDGELAITDGVANQTEMAAADMILAGEGSGNDSEAAAVDSPAEAECVTFDCRVDKAMYIAPVGCKPAIEKLSKYDFEWTDKWYESVFTNYMPVEGEPDQAYLVGDKIKFQNGFGAWANMIYICTYDLDRNVVLDVAVQQGRL